MESILEQLYNGAIRPSEIDLPPTKEYRQIDDCFSEKWQAFFKSIPAEAKGRFFEVEDEMDHIQYLRLRAAFVSGFRLGVQIMIESIS